LHGFCCFVFLLKSGGRQRLWLRFCPDRIAWLPADPGFRKNKVPDFSNGICPVDLKICNFTRF